MLKVSKSILWLLLAVFFLLISSLLGTTSSEQEGHVLKIFTLPTILSQSAYICYFLLVLILILIGVFKFSKAWKIKTPIPILLLAYLILLIWSLVTNSDQVRYFTIFISVAFVPIGLLYVINRINYRAFALCTIVTLVFLLLLSIVFSILNFPMFSRVSGIHSNPNLMGMWLASILTVILYFNNNINRNLTFLIVASVVVLVILTGSRLALGVMLLIIIPYIASYKVSSLFVFSMLVILFYIFLQFFVSQIGFDLRAFEVGSAISDSGRAIIWERAIDCVYSEPLIGHGMFGAENCVNIGNVHNSYLRISVMLGIPLTIIFFSLFFYSLIKIFMMSSNPFIKSYFLGLPLAFFSEDYIVGFASPFFPFFIFILTLFLFDLKKTKV